ncbi:GNAT family N-acetyltransferase [Acidihalobacter ferrooxydans]|uniref:tRNA(Met) cytidine acetyltransferase TmcA n=1 Tax=Acidihalobacter ferrooxydans TaxID=1765967 RepID=A0A1P8UJX1_9GAMM|nr:GNAT family N-acetyltransferase [Acidihalobacter ferrooxydans]APZ44136.1 hypothetical protein BW247_14400 [Acidihalobacter ferrooxydans]
MNISYSDTDGFFQRLQTAARASRQRRVVLLRGAPHWCATVAARVPLALGVEAADWLGVPPPGWNALVGGATELLGRERDLVGLDVRESVDADLFGALVGGLRAGGVLLLSAPASGSRVAGRFMARWERLLRAAPECVSVEQGQPWPAIDWPCTSVSAPAPDGQGCLTADQRKAVDAVCRVATGHRRRPVVLTADRGRGKSAAFGLAAARLMAGRGARVVLTGPGLAAVGAAFDAARSRLPAAVVARRGALRYGAASMQFVAPDALVREPVAADVVLVDEAAALPVALLTRLLARYARIAFATTVHGYEGSGQAFRVRFAAVLERATPGWRAVELAAPIRWAAGDPLEALAARLLLLDAEPASVSAVDALRALAVERFDRDRLVRDEALLREWFGLLILAHYRTRPRDLQQWLEGDGVMLWGLRRAGRLVAVAVGVREGGLAPDAAAAVARGERRWRGHLVAQTLAAHLGQVDAAVLQGLRIVRIAVHPALRRRGLGVQLLRAVAAEARAEGLDWLGASFGADAGLLQFWRAAGLAPVRIGFTREATSGAHAALMLQGLSAAGEALRRSARQRFTAGLPGWLGDALRGLEPALVCALLEEDALGAVSAAAISEAARFARGACTFEDAQPWLRELALARLGRAWRDARRLSDSEERSGASGQWPAYPVAAADSFQTRQASTLRDDEWAALAARLVQQQSWAEVARQLALPGRAQLIEVLRGAVSRLLAARASASDA